MASTPKSKLDAQLPDKTSLSAGEKAPGAAPDGSYGEDGDVNPADGHATGGSSTRDANNPSKPEKVQR